MVKKIRSIDKIKKKYGANCFKKWGSPAAGGGSPILMSYKLHKPVKGYKVSHT